MTAISHALLTFLVLMMVKATLLLAATVLCLRLMSRSSASNRHMICLVSLAGLLLLPLLMIAVPSWNVESRLPAVAFVVSSAAQVRTTGSWSSAMTGDRILLFVWLSGAAFLLLRSVLGWGLMQAQRVKSVPLQDEAWHREMEAIARQNGLTPSRISLRAGRVNSTLTCGVRRPAILVPPVAVTWSAFQRRAILLHEMAHIRRRDCLFNYVAQAACALFWFHPLAWSIAATLYREQEFACDDAVLSHDMEPAEYASVLLESARTLPSGLLLACAFVGRSRPNHLRARFAYLLDGTRDHASRAGLVKPFASAFLALLMLVSIIKPVNAEEIYKIGGEVSAPKVVIKSEPDYTQEAKDAGIEGTALLSVTIGSDGVPRDITVTRSLDPGLDANAIKAIETWLFEPGQRRGKAVSVRANIEVNFRLK